jgi:hypothetical protein
MMVPQVEVGDKWLVDAVGDGGEMLEMGERCNLVPG